jgi:hypothetical protein
MPASKAVFVLIHGGWHNHSAWDPGALSSILIDICVRSLADESAAAS